MVVMLVIEVILIVMLMSMENENWPDLTWIWKSSTIFIRLLLSVMNVIENEELSLISR